MTRRVMRDAEFIALILIGLGCVAAGLAAAFGSSGLRDWYGLDPAHPIHIGVLELWADNGRALLLVFANAMVVVCWPRARWFADSAVMVVIALNVLLVAVAFGAYGWPLVRLAPGHYVLELMALAVAGAAYLHARRERRWDPSVMAWCASIAVVLLLGAAVLESAG